LVGWGWEWVESQDFAAHRDANASTTGFPVCLPVVEKFVFYTFVYRVVVQTSFFTPVCLTGVENFVFTPVCLPV